MPFTVSITTAARQRRLRTLGAAALMAALLTAPWSTTVAHASTLPACDTSNISYDVDGTNVYEFVRITSSCTWVVPPSVAKDAQGHRSIGGLAFFAVAGGGAAGLTDTTTFDGQHYPGGGGGGGGMGTFIYSSALPDYLDLIIGTGGLAGGTPQQKIGGNSIVRAWITGSPYSNDVLTVGGGGHGGDGNGDQHKGSGDGEGGDGSSGISPTGSTGGIGGGGGGGGGSGSHSGGDGGKNSNGSAGAAADTATAGGGGNGGGDVSAGLGADGNGAVGGPGVAVTANAIKTFAKAFPSGTLLAPGGQGGAVGINATIPKSASYGAGGNAYPAADLADPVKASNRDGNAGVIVIRYKASVPHKPVQPTVVAGDAKATITVAESTTAGSPPESFTVQAYDNGTAVPGKTCTVMGRSGSCDITGLTNGTAYTYAAIATNPAGNSLLSDQSAAATPTAAPTNTTPSTPTPSTPSGGDNYIPPTNTSPIPRPVVTLPAISNGVNTTTPSAAAAALVGGSPVTVATVIVAAPVAGASPNGVTVTAGTVSAGFTGPAVAGVEQLGNPIAIAGQPLNVSLSGLAAGSTVNVYAMPTGTLIGTLTVNADGKTEGAPTLSSENWKSITGVQLAATNADGSAVDLALGITMTAPAEPIPTPVGELPEPQLGGSYVMVNQVPVPTVPEQVGSSLVVVEQQAQVSLSADTGVGQPLPIGGDGALRIQDDGSVRVEGTGMVGMVDVFAFSTPTFIGRVMVKADGTFVGALPVPPSLGAGRHTIQLVGEAKNGKEVAVSLGVVKDQKTTSRATSVLFAEKSSVLTKKATDALRLLVKRVGTNLVTVTASGYVQKSKMTQNNTTLSTARAKAVTDFLRSLGVRGTFEYKGNGVAGTKANARRVDLVIVRNK